VLVGLAVFTTVLITGETVVEVAKDVVVAGGNRVPVAKDAPGVRKRLIQDGAVRMDASTGSINPPGLRVRKSLFGSRLESILAFIFQPGEKRTANCPAKITHRNPIRRMIGIMSQSRRSRSDVFILESTER
jgi:hypothetical protein